MKHIDMNHVTVPVGLNPILQVPENARKFLFSYSNVLDANIVAAHVEYLKTDELEIVVTKADGARLSANIKLTPCEQ